MKVWLYIEQSGDWECISECPANWANWVTECILKANPNLPARYVQYGTEKPAQPLRLGGDQK